MFECKGCTTLRSEVSYLRGLIADCQEQVRQAEARHDKERERLTTQLLAATRPHAITALQGQEGRGVPVPPRPNFPGIMPARPIGTKPPDWLAQPKPPPTDEPIKLSEGA